MAQQEGGQRHFPTQLAPGFGTSGVDGPCRGAMDKRQEGEATESAMETQPHRAAMRAPVPGPTGREDGRYASCPGESRAARG
jgi:hypothetical protein